MSILYERIKMRREQLNMSQEELAEKLGYKSRSSINKIEKRKSDIPQSKIISFAKALGVSESWLMGHEYLDDLPTINGGVIKDKTYIADALMGSKLEKVQYKKSIPVLGRISAGLPILAVENIEGYENVEDMSLDYALIVKGDSMNGARIYEGDLVYVTREVDYENGDIVIALINGNDATIKRFYQYNNEVILRPENPTIKEQRYALEEVQLLGKVKEVKFKV